MGLPSARETHETLYKKPCAAEEGIGPPCLGGAGSVLKVEAGAETLDKINDRWVEFIITPALMMGMGDIILDRISFGGVKELEEIYFDLDRTNLRQVSFYP